MITPEQAAQLARTANSIRVGNGAHPASDLLVSLYAVMCERTHPEDVYAAADDVLNEALLVRNMASDELEEHKLRNRR